MIAKRLESKVQKYYIDCVTTISGSRCSLVLGEMLLKVMILLMFALLHVTCKQILVIVLYCVKSTIHE